MYRFNFPRQVIQIPHQPNHKPLHTHTFTQALFGAQQRQSRFCMHVVWFRRINYMLKSFTGRKKKSKIHIILSLTKKQHKRPMLTAPLAQIQINHLPRCRAQDTQTYNPFPVKATVWRIVIDWTTHSDRTQCSDHKIADGKLQSLSYEAPGRHYTKPEPERDQKVERTLALSWSENSHSLTHHTLTQWAAVVGFKSYVCFFLFPF